MPSRHFVQIDIDPMQLGRNYPVSVGVVGAAGRVLAEIGERLAAVERAPRRFGVLTHEDPALVGPGAGRRITPHRALWELQQILPRDTRYSCDIGEHLLFATHYLAIDDPQGFMIMTGLASMGSGIGSAIGIKLADPRRTGARVCGDGCFAMAMGDLSTAAQQRLPIVIAVLNDERYGMVEIGHQAVFGRRPPYPTGPMNIPELARALGAYAVVASRAGDILALDLEAALAQGPVVIDIRIDREARMPKNKRNEALSVAIGRDRLLN